MILKKSPLIPHIPYRGVHLDFHTSGKIKGIGKKFSKHQFQAALRLGHVNTINIFSKCHHGFSYHPTQVGKTHPHLNFDLFGEQLAACHEIGVEMPAYLSAGLDDYVLEKEPGLLCITATGENPLDASFKRVCFNSPYLEYLCRQIEEVVDTYAVDGIWLDIVGVAPCLCTRCRAELIRRKLNPENPEHVLQLGREVQVRYLEATTKSARKNNNKMRVVHNAGHIPRGDKVFLRFNSQIEMESLPTGGWGYNHFPVSAKYAATLKKPSVGMTGKFHNTWGEFGGFKHANALRYETSAMLAYGTHCSVGDQLHPSGEMNEDTYERIGVAYAEVEKKEPFCLEANPVSSVAILSIESLRSSGVLDAHKAERDIWSDAGASTMLMERQIMFDVIDTEADFNRYAVIILPDEGRLTDALAKKLTGFIKKGGKLILSYESGLKTDQDVFYFPLGKVAGRSAWEMEYLKAGKEILALDQAKRLVRGPFVIPCPSLNVFPQSGAKVLASRLDPYFNRTIAHYTSHQHAPDATPSPYPGIIMTKDVLYFSHPLFTRYAERGQMLYRDLFYEAFRLFLGEPSTWTSLPSLGRLSLMEQPAEKRYVVHLLYASPIKRGEKVFPRWGIHSIEVIEDILPIDDVECRVRVPKKVSQVRLALSGLELPFKIKDGFVHFTVPRLECHEMVLLEYAARAS